MKSNRIGFLTWKDREDMISRVLLLQKVFYPITKFQDKSGFGHSGVFLHVKSSFPALQLAKKQVDES
jgi:hypothetical protein